MAGFIRSLFESALKTNSSLEFAVITGCLRISKESIFTGISDLKIISILNEQYDEYFGFTENEVHRIYRDYDMSQKYDTFRKWYNGCVFGNANIYNPWSVIQFMDDLKENSKHFPTSYWANTSSNSIVRRLIDMADGDTRGEIEILIEGKTLAKPIHEDITYEEVYETMDNLWNFMFFTGYFRKVQEWMDEKTKDHYLSQCGNNNDETTGLVIPNREIHWIFAEQIQEWFESETKKTYKSWRTFAGHLRKMMCLL